MNHKGTTNRKRLSKVTVLKLGMPQDKEGRELCMLLQVFLEITVTTFMQVKCTACLTEEVKSHLFMWK